MPEHAYTISQDEIERLRRQIGELKRNPSKEPASTHAMVESMDRLYEALSRLIVLLEGANRAMAQDALQGIKDEHAKLDKLLEQNEKLARGIVALADLVREQRGRPVFPVPQPIPTPVAQQPLPTTGQPQLPGPHHDETSFLAQPVLGAATSSLGMPSLPALQSPQGMPSGAALASAAGPNGQLPPLPPMPSVPPAGNTAVGTAPPGLPLPLGQKRPILKGFS